VTACPPKQQRRGFTRGATTLGPASTTSFTPAFDRARTSAATCSLLLLRAGKQAGTSRVGRCVMLVVRGLCDVRPAVRSEMRVPIHVPTAAVLTCANWNQTTRIGRNYGSCVATAALIIRRAQVRVLPGPPQTLDIRPNHPTPHTIGARSPTATERPRGVASVKGYGGIYVARTAQWRPGNS
jgi:hypothetical protein